MKRKLPKIVKGLDQSEDPTLGEQRLAICEVCENYKVHDILPNTCSVCGCVMRIKVMFTTLHCPIGKW